jgi:hypothetical protein
MEKVWSPVTVPFSVAVVVVIALAATVVSVTSAEAGDTATNVNPATIKAVVAPRARTELNADRNDQRLLLEPSMLLIAFLPSLI